MSAADGLPSSRHVIIRRRSDPWCAAFEAKVDAEGIPVALPHRASWVSRFGTSSSLFVGLTDESRRPLYGCGVDVVHLRSLPGHTIYRIQRFGYGLTGDEISVVLRELAAYARTRASVLRLIVETFASEQRGRESLAAIAGKMGFTPCIPPQRYTRTLRLSLSSDRDALFEALPRTARRNLRAAEKSGLVVRVIDEPSFAPAIAALEQEAFTRTGGHSSATDWPTLIRYARDYPCLVRVVGIFSVEEGSSSELLGFATGRAHGDHVEYASAGTTRKPGLKISIGYPLLWNLIEWAHDLGASWFDFGGITAGTVSDSGDALGGISDFKRHFGGEEIEVGGEWSLDVRPMRSAMADAISRVAHTVRGR